MWELLQGATCTKSMRLLASLLRIHNGLISILKEHVNFDAPAFSRGMSVVIWFAPWPPVRESRVRIRLPHRNLTKFILVWLFFKKRYSSTSGLLSFKKPVTVLWTRAKNYYLVVVVLCAPAVLRPRVLQGATAPADPKS